MKKITMLLMGLLLGCAGISVQAEDPANFLPKDAVLLLYFDAVRMTDMPWLKDIGSAHPDTSDKVKQFEALCARYQIKENDFFSGPVYIAARDEDQIGIYAKTNISEEILPQFVSEMVKQGNKTVTVAEQTIADRKAFVFTNAAEKDKTPQSFALLYLAKDVVMVFQVNAANIELLKASTGGCALLAKIDRTQLAAFLCEPPKMLDASNAKPDVAMIDMRLDLTGAKQSDLKLSADVDFVNKEKAQEFGMQCQMMAPMMLGMLFGKDQKLAGELIQGLQVTLPSEKRLSVQFALSEATLKAVGEYLKNPANMPNFGQPGVGAAPATATTTAAPAVTAQP